jgi:transcriptional regulator with XRE-family HTH domain
LDEIKRELVAEFTGSEPEYRHEYLESFARLRVAAQIRANRRMRRWSQKTLAKKAGLHQSQVSELENPNKETKETHNLRTLQKIARGFDVALVVRFLSFGEMLDDFSSGLGEDALRACSFPNDPAFSPASEAVVPSTQAGQMASPLLPYGVKKSKETIDYGQPIEVASVTPSNWS